MNYKIVSKYIKDISFEIPSAEIFTFLDKEINQYAVKCDIKSNSFKKNIIEVSTILKLIPNINLKRKRYLKPKIYYLCENCKKELDPGRHTIYIKNLETFSLMLNWWIF